MLSEAEGSRQLASGKRPKAKDMLLTRSNARRVADELSKMRGAAMKVGQTRGLPAQVRARSALAMDWSHPLSGMGGRQSRRFLPRSMRFWRRRTEPRARSALASSRE